MSSGVEVNSPFQPVALQDRRIGDCVPPFGGQCSKVAERHADGLPLGPNLFAATDECLVNNIVPT